MEDTRSTTNVRLRLHHGGKFQQVGESGEWRYTGGSAFNDTLPVTLVYSELCQRVNAKVGEACSIRYLSPGEPLDPDALVNVTDDDDLQELYNEYLEALARPDTPSRTLRIHVFLAAALQFEIEREVEEEASLCCYDDPEDLNEFGFDDLGSDVLSSCDPSSDTAWVTAATTTAGGISQHLPPGHCSGGHTTSAGTLRGALASGPSGSAPSGLGARSSTPRPGEHRGDAHVELRWPGQQGGGGAGFEQHALLNLNRSLQVAPGILPAAPYGAVGVGHPGYPCAEEPQLEDPYGEEEEEAQQDQQRGYTGQPGKQAQGDGPPGCTPGWGGVGAGAGGEGGQEVAGTQNHDISEGNKLAALYQKGLQLLPNGTSLYNKPLDRVRDAASGLPSHISAFGEGHSRDSGGGAARGKANGGGGAGSLNLPSHISAFGDEAGDTTMSPGEGCDERNGGAALTARHEALLGRALAWEGGSQQCITQEFGIPSGGGSMNASPAGALLPRPSQPGAGAGLELRFHAGAGAAGVDAGDGVPPVTPKVTLLGSMQHVARSSVSTCSKIGEGAFGEVSCADVFPYGMVAIKWLKKDRFAKYSESFQREAEVLARLNHPNIIRMFGLVTEPANRSSPPGSVVAGLLPGGDVGRAAGSGGSGAGNGTGGGVVIAGIMMEYLRGGSLAQRFRSLAAAGRRLSLRERCRIARQAALGMAYLHDQSPAVIHFDLKPDNLLLEGDNEANLLVKVADFGLSKHKIQSYVTCHDLRGTLPYMAPELVRCPNQVCEKCDVWSMGVVMWEMFTLEVPFQELTAQDILRGLMQGTLHLRMPPGIEPEWQRLISACMESEPGVRPTFRQLAERLEEMSRALAAQAAQAQATHDFIAAQQVQQVQVQQQLVAAHAAASKLMGPTAGAGLGGVGLGGLPLPMQPGAPVQADFHTALAAATLGQLQQVGQVAGGASTQPYGHAPLLAAHAAPGQLFAPLPAPPPPLHHHALPHALFTEHSGADAAAAAAFDGIQLHTAALAAAVVGAPLVRPPHPHAHHHALLMAHGLPHAQL